MGLKDKFTKYYTDSYLKKYGDRLTQVQGNVLSVKVEAKSILWIFHKIIVTIIVRPERSKSVLKTVYKRNRWFKKPIFIQVSQGNLVLIQGLKGKKSKKSTENREFIQIMNIRNLTTKKDLVPMDGKEPKVQRIKQKDQRFK